jgi:hypothetical protein
MQPCRSIENKRRFIDDSREDLQSSLRIVRFQNPLGIGSTEHQGTVRAIGGICRSVELKQCLYLEAKRFDDDLIPVLQQLAPNALPFEPGPIPGAEIFKKNLFRREGELSVSTGDADVLQTEITVLGSSERECSLGEAYPLEEGVSSIHHEFDLSFSHSDSTGTQL